MNKALAILSLLLLASCAGMPNGKKSPCPNKPSTDVFAAQGYVEEPKDDPRGCPFESFDVSKAGLGDRID